MRFDLEIGKPVRQPAISTDGSQLAFVVDDGLAVRRLDAEAIHVIPATAGARHPFYSPDGEWLAYFQGDKLMKVRTGGGTPVVVCNAKNGGGGDWNGDRGIVAVLDADAGLAHVRGNRVAQITHTGLSQWHRKPGWFYAGAVLYSEQDNTGRSVLRADDKVLVSGSRGGRMLGNGFLIYEDHGGLVGRQVVASSGELAGPPVQLVEPGDGDIEFDVSRNGTIVYGRKQDSFGGRVLRVVLHAGEELKRGSRQ